MPINPKYPNAGGRGGGRPKGAKNKVPSIIQAGIFNALTAGVGTEEEATKFFTQMKEENPVQFMQIVSKLLSQQVKADVNTNENRTWTIKLIDNRQQEPTKQIKQAEIIENEG